MTLVPRIVRLIHLDCMRDVEPCSMATKGTEGKVCVVETMGTLNMVFVDGDKQILLICIT